MIDKAQATQRLDAIEREAAELRKIIERPEPPKPKQVEFVGHLANYHLFPDRFEITLSGTGDWYDIMPRGPVTVIVRKQGEPLELPFTVDDTIRAELAARAMQGILSSVPYRDFETSELVEDGTLRNVANIAVRAADALIEELNK